jgi:hypothetical protein
VPVSGNAATTGVRTAIGAHPTKANAVAAMTPKFIRLEILICST